MDVEDLLGDHGTTHQGADVLTKVGDDRNQGVAQYVAQHDLTVRHTFGTCGAHVILGDVGGDFGASQSNDVGHRHRSEHHGRHEQVDEARVCACRHRQYRPLNTKDILHDEAGDEGRHGNKQQGDDQDDGVVPLALLEARDNAEDHTEDRLEHERHQAEPDGDREGAGDFVENRLPGEGIAEVQGQCILQVDEVLNDERLVEMVFCADLGCDGLIDGLVSEHGLDGVARQGEYKGIYQKSRTENHGDHLQNASQKILTHTVAPYFLDRPERV